MREISFSRLWPLLTFESKQYQMIQKDPKAKITEIVSERLGPYVRSYGLNPEIIATLAQQPEHGCTNSITSEGTPTAECALAKWYEHGQAYALTVFATPNPEETRLRLHSRDPSGTWWAVQELQATQAGEQIQHMLRGRPRFYLGDNSDLTSDSAPIDFLETIVAKPLRESVAAFYTPELTIPLEDVPFVSAGAAIGYNIGFHPIGFLDQLVSKDITLMSFTAPDGSKKTAVDIHDDRTIDLVVDKDKHAIEFSPSFALVLQWLGTSLFNPNSPSVLTYTLGDLGAYTVNLENLPLLPEREQQILEQFLTETQHEKE